MSEDLPRPTFSDLKEQYGIYRDYMKHEDDLLNQRSTLHLVAQGLLFTALGTLFGGKDKPIWGTAHVTLVYILVFLGLTVATVAFLGIWAANRAIDELREQWQGVLKCYNNVLLPILPGLAGAGIDRIVRFGKVPALFVPPVVALVWMLIGGLTTLALLKSDVNPLQDGSFW